MDNEAKATIQCPMCSKKFHNKGTLANHLRMIHCQNERVVESLSEKAWSDWTNVKLSNVGAKATPRPWTWFDLSEDYGHERVSVVHNGPLFYMDAEKAVGFEDGELKANASLIVKAVNEYDENKEQITSLCIENSNKQARIASLLTSNEALLGACRDALTCLIAYQDSWGKKSSLMANTVKTIQEAIQNATKQRG